LGVKDFASTEDVKTAYRKLSKIFHPDVNDGGPFLLINSKKFKKLMRIFQMI